MSVWLAKSLRECAGTAHTLASSDRMIARSNPKIGVWLPGLGLERLASPQRSRGRAYPTWRKGQPRHLPAEAEAPTRKTTRRLHSRRPADKDHSVGSLSSDIGIPQQWP